MASPKMMRSAVLHFSSTPAGRSPPQTWLPSLPLSCIPQNAQFIPHVDCPCCFLVPVGDLLFLPCEYLTPCTPPPTKHYKVRPRNDVTMLFPFSLARKSSCSLFLLGTVCPRSPYRRGAKLRRTVTSCLPAQTHQGAKWEKYFKKHSYSSLRF